MLTSRPKLIVLGPSIALLRRVAGAGLLSAAMACSGCSRTVERDEAVASDRGTDEIRLDAPQPESERRIDRSLALATFDRVGELVRDSHFDPAHLETIGWDDAHDELRPRAAAARTKGELRRVIGDLLDRLGQSHFVLLPQEMVDAMEPEEAPAPKRARGAAADGDADPSGDTRAERAADADADLDAGADAAEDVPDDGRPGTTGIDVRLVDGKPVVTKVTASSPAAKAGVAPGWIVDEVNGRSTDELIARLPDDLTPRLRQMYVQNAIVGRLDGDAGTTVDVVLIDGQGRPVELELTRRPQPGTVSRIGNLPAIATATESRRLTTPAGQQAGYIWFNIWLVPVMPPLAAAVDRFRDAEGIVIDLRGNPGGIGGMSMGVAGHFIDERLPFGTMTVRNAAPLNFVAMPQRAIAGRRVTPYAGPLAILVDALTGSTSEIFAGGMQSVGRARVFGETTMGAALPARMPRLPNGDVLLHAFADYVDANGVRLEGRGVVPDEPVEPSRSALLEGRDPVLEAALAWIDEAGAVQPDGDESE